MEKLQENLKGMNSEELKNYTLLLKNTVNDVYLFTQDILLWLNNQKEDFNIIKKKTNLKDLLLKTARIYQDICLSQNNSIEILIKQDILVNTASDLLNVVIRNLLDNANKFTTNGTITITAGVINQFTFITITDTGMGMDKDKISELINPTLNNWNIQTTRNHLGYKIINDLMQKLGGTLRMTSELKKGTSVSIYLTTN
jgi:K+-sensing histidine kinase KdpD